MSRVSVIKNPDVHHIKRDRMSLEKREWLKRNHKRIMNKRYGKAA